MQLSPMCQISENMYSSLEYAYFSNKVFVMLHPSLALAPVDTNPLSTQLISGQKHKLFFLIFYFIKYTLHKKLFQMNIIDLMHSISHINLLYDELF